MGVQEKATFVQQGAHLSAAGLRQPIMALPGALLLMLPVLGGLVLVHHGPLQQVPTKVLDDDQLLDQSEAGGID